MQRKLHTRDLVPPSLYARMKAVGLPAGFILACVAWLVRHDPPSPGSLDAVEFFAGVKTWAAELRKQNFVVETFEKNDEPIHEDILSDFGFLRALRCIFSCRRDSGVTHWATVCSSWVQVNRATSGRSLQSPLGREYFPYVAEANVMTSRTALFLLICSCLGVDWVLEQPNSSLMCEHPRIKQVIELGNVGGLRKSKRVFTNMGGFGARSKKPTMLLGTPTFLHRLHRRWKACARPSLVRYYTDARGRKAFQGGVRLKKSQQYPPGYGKAFASYMKQAPILLDDDFDMAVVTEQAAHYREAGRALWTDASLGSLWHMVMPKGQ